MNQSFLKFGVLLVCTIFASVILLAGLALAGTGDKTGVNIMEKEGVGKFLADGSGMSLYSFAKDGKNTSNCIEGCAVNWPPFYVDLSLLGEGLEPEDFAVIMRSDGRQQTTFKGMPLYYFKNDKYPGDIFGDGLGGSWSLITP